MSITKTYHPRVYAGHVRSVNGMDYKRSGRYVGDGVKHCWNLYPNGKLTARDGQRRVMTADGNIVWGNDGFFGAGTNVHGRGRRAKASGIVFPEDILEVPQTIPNLISWVDPDDDDVFRNTFYQWGNFTGIERMYDKGSLGNYLYPGQVEGFPSPPLRYEANGLGHVLRFLDDVNFPENTRPQQMRHIFPISKFKYEPIDLFIVMRWFKSSALERPEFEGSPANTRYENICQLWGDVGAGMHVVHQWFAADPNDLSRRKFSQFPIGPVTPVGGNPTQYMQDPAAPATQDYLIHFRKTPETGVGSDVEKSYSWVNNGNTRFSMTDLITPEPFNRGVRLTLGDDKLYSTESDRFTDYTFVNLWDVWSGAIDAIQGYDIAEVLVYNRTLEEAELDTLMDEHFRVKYDFIDAGWSLTNVY